MGLRINASDIVKLKRQFNKPYTEANVDSLCAYYQAVGGNKGKLNYIYYFCLTLYAQQDGRKGKTLPLTQILSVEYKKGNITLLKRFKLAIEEGLSEDSLFIYKLGQIVRQLWGIGYKVDVDILLRDLCIMQSEDSHMLEQWIREVYCEGLKEKENN